MTASIETALGTTIPVFIGITLVVIGFAAFMTGQALANAWRTRWHVFASSALLGLADRFLTWALFQGELLSLSGYVIDTLMIWVICSVAYQLTLARRMTTQYPWLYERTGLFGWREKSDQSR